MIHPAAFTYKLPDTVSFAEGAMVEPFAIGMQAALRARIQPGDIAVVTGAGPIGMMVALAALGGTSVQLASAQAAPHPVATLRHHLIPRALASAPSS